MDRPESAVSSPSGNESAEPAENKLASKREFLWNIHTYTNNYVQFADTKAAFCVGISSAFMAALFTAKAHELFRDGGPWTILSALSLGAFALLAISIGAAVMVVRPRDWLSNRNLEKGSERVSETGFVFWEDIAKNFKTANLFADRYDRQSEMQLNRGLSLNLYDLAIVCRRKFIWVNVAVCAATAGAALAVVVMLFKH